MKQMTEFLRNFSDNPERLQKYMEFLLFAADSDPYSLMSRERGLRRVTVVLTTKCNLSCAWCHRQEERVKGYLNREMAWEDVLRLLPQLKGFKWLHFGGLGEPMLYPRFYDALKLAKQYVEKVRTTTNGTLLNEENCRKLVETGIDRLEVSIDGFSGTTNKDCRGCTEDKIIQGLETLGRAGKIPVQINIVVSNVNYDALFLAIDRLKNVPNLERIHSIPLFMTDYMVARHIKDISYEQYYALLNHWKTKSKEYGLDIEFWPDINELTLDPVKFLKRLKNICFAVYEDPTINVHGCIVPCGRLADISLDSVFELGFKDAWNGEKILAWRKTHLAGAYGKDCQRECGMKNICIT
jgi:MoaA/NifB/PqqE/SkfB family radical SAM enzyme